MVLSCCHLMYDYDTRKWESLSQTLVQFRNGESLRAAPCWYDLTQDVMLLVLEKAPTNVRPIRFVPLKRDPATKIIVTMPVAGEVVYWIGYGSAGGFMCGDGPVEGYVAGLETWKLPNARILYTNRGYPARDGDSGCPVFNAKGQQVAVLHRNELDPRTRQPIKMLATSVATVYEAFAPIPTQAVRAEAVWANGELVTVVPAQCGPSGCGPGGFISGGGGIRGPFGGGVGGGFRIGPGDGSAPPNTPPPNYQPLPPGSVPPFIEQPKPEPEQPQPPLPPPPPPEPEDVPYLWIWAVLAFVLCGLLAGGTYYAQLD